ncbi:MAG: ribosome silencing factor, partial [Pseudomonadota bacterium]|nr:ribosome silencing factor [Pseudomonadota bacterium]
MTKSEEHARDPGPERFKAVVERSLEDDKAEDVVVVDLAGKTSIADYMVIASGRSTRQVGTIAEHLIAKLKASGARAVRVEG